MTYYLSIGINALSNKTYSERTLYVTNILDKSFQSDSLGLSGYFIYMLLPQIELPFRY